MHQGVLFVCMVLVCQIKRDFSYFQSSKIRIVTTVKLRISWITGAYNAILILYHLQVPALETFINSQSSSNFFVKLNFTRH